MFEEVSEVIQHTFVQARNQPRYSQRNRNHTVYTGDSYKSKNALFVCSHSSLSNLEVSSSNLGAKFFSDTLAGLVSLLNKESKSTVKLFEEGDFLLGVGVLGVFGGAAVVISLKDLLSWSGFFNSFAGLLYRDLLSFFSQGVLPGGDFSLQEFVGGVTSR